MKVARTVLRRGSDGNVTLLSDLGSSSTTQIRADILLQAKIENNPPRKLKFNGHRDNIVAVSPSRPLIWCDTKSLE